MSATGILKAVGLSFLKWKHKRNAVPPEPPSVRITDDGKRVRICKDGKVSYASLVPRYPPRKKKKQLGIELSPKVVSVKAILPDKTEKNVTMQTAKFLGPNLDFYASLPGYRITLHDICSEIDLPTGTTLEITFSNSKKVVAKMPNHSLSVNCRTALRG